MELVILIIFELQTGPINQTMGRQIEREDGVRQFHQSITISVPLLLLEIQGKSFIKLRKILSDNSRFYYYKMTFFKRPFCYTLDPNVRWEYCDCEPCNRTRTGLQCQRWDATYPHKPNYLPVGNM